MKFKKQSPLHVVLLCLILIFQFSCSKDSDLLTDYVLADSLDSKNIANLVVDDTYQVSLSGSMVLDVLANDTFENEAEVVIAETSTPTNGTVIINNDETLTYTPDDEIVEQVSDTTNASTVEVVDTFTYTVEVDNGDGTATTEEASVVITTGDNASRQDVVNISPWDYCQDGNPIGGGAGYDRIITSGDITITTSDTYSTFKTKIEAATSGQVVFINNDVSMDLTNLGGDAILVPAGVTVASDRGNGSSEGAFLYTNQMKHNSSGYDRPVFLAAGINIRITGFTLRGPYGFSGTYASSEAEKVLRRLKHGIASNYDNAEVDNMHIYNFPASATNFGQYTSNSTYWGPLQYSSGHKVHHNYIHNNLQNGMGYGVSTSHAYVEVYSNVFHSHRHDIAGSGQLDNSFEAYCNTIISEFQSDITFKQGGGATDAVNGTKVYAITSDGSGNSISSNPKQSGNTHHNFNMHPEYYCDGNVWEYGKCDPPAGNEVYVHHNDFQDDGVARHSQTTDMQNVSISGIPVGLGRVEYNRTVRTYLANWGTTDNVSILLKQKRTLGPLPKGITTLGNIFNGD